MKRAIHNLSRFGLVLGVILFLTGCGNSPTLDVPDDQATKTAEETLATVDAASLTSTFVAEYQDVSELAKRWNRDATLYSLTTTWPSTLATGRAKRVYVFGAPTVPNDWWLVTINELTSQRVRSITPKEDYLGATLGAMPLEFWQINAVEALQAAEAAGGNAFREANPGAEVSASLARLGPKDWLWWVVQYRSDGGRELKIRVHPASGQIYDENGEPIITSTE